jgi:hypothetical protein
LSAGDITNPALGFAPNELELGRLEEKLSQATWSPFVGSRYKSFLIGCFDLKPFSIKTASANFFGLSQSCLSIKAQVVKINILTQ